MVSQLYSYAEFKDDFLLRVGNQCEIDIKADLISIESVYHEFGVVTSCK